jgi:hypothetical protein
MVEGREHFGFALKARQAIRIAAHADLAGDFVGAEARTGGDGQVSR